MMNEVASLREEIAGLAELLVELTEDAAVGIIDFKDGVIQERRFASHRSDP